jgi:hypothetical protein
MNAATLHDLASTVIDSFGAFLTALFTGFYATFVGPLWTAIATALGLPVG